MSYNIVIIIVSLLFMQYNTCIHVILYMYSCINVCSECDNGEMLDKRREEEEEEGEEEEEEEEWKGERKGRMRWRMKMRSRE